MNAPGKFQFQVNGYRRARVFMTTPNPPVASHKVRGARERTGNQQPKLALRFSGAREAVRCPGDGREKKRKESYVLLMSAWCRVLQKTTTWHRLSVVDGVLGLIFRIGYTISDKR